MGLFTIIAVIIAIFGAGFAVYCFLPIGYDLGYGPASTQMQNLPIQYKIQRDNLYTFTILAITVLGLGVSAFWGARRMTTTDS